MEISQTGWEVQGEIMRRVEWSPRLPCCFCRVHKKDSEESSSSSGHQSRDCVYLSVFIKDRQYRWRECGWQCICEEFKEINSIWGSKVAGENTPISRRTFLIISSRTHRGNLWDSVSSLPFVNKRRVCSECARCKDALTDFVHELNGACSKTDAVLLVRCQVNYMDRRDLRGGNNTPTRQILATETLFMQ